MSEHYERPEFSLEEYNVFRQSLGLPILGPDFVAWMHEQNLSTRYRRQVFAWIRHWQRFQDEKERSEQ